MTLYNLEKSIKLSVSEFSMKFDYSYDYTKLNHFCNELRELINGINEYKQL